MAKHEAGILLAGRSMELKATMNELEREIEKHAPWITRIHHAGRAYGGDYDPASDPRVLRYIESLRSRGEPGSVRKILECGCLEGGHTVVLAREFPTASILATDVREDNLAKSRLHARLADVSNVEFVLEDLEEPGQVFKSNYDSVFCVGLLYHLRDPAGFLAHCAAVAKHLWLWTVYCAESDATWGEGKHRGRLYNEPVESPLSSSRPESLFPTLGSLCGMLWDAGYTRIELLNTEETANGNGPAILLQAEV